MYINLIWVALITLALLQNTDGKRTKKKRINNDVAESTPQPNVLTYSTFGFNDVGSYDGFVPSSPDYTNHFTKNKQESSTRLYAPAFPSALESTGLGSYYDPQPDIGSFSISSDGYQTSGQPYQHGTSNDLTSFNNANNDQSKNLATKEIDLNSPIYGTKINLKGKNKIFDNFNHTEYNTHGSTSTAINDGLSKNVNNNYPKILSIPQSIDNDKYFMLPSPISSSLKFPKVVDFTNIKNYYPTSVENNFQDANQNPLSFAVQNNAANDANINPYPNYNTAEFQEESSKNKLNFKDERIKSDKENSDFNYFTSEDISDVKINFKNNKNKNDFKDKVKNHQLGLNNNNNDSKKSRNPTKGYDYSTNYSTTSFRYDYGAPKRPFNNSIDEIAPASSNLDYVGFELPEKDFTGLKQTQSISSPYDIESIISNNYNEKYKPSEEYLNSFKNLYATVPSTTSHWGNLFKTAKYASYKNNVKKPFYKDDINDEIIHIPKRNHNLKFGKLTDNKFSDWSLSNTFKPYKISDDTEQYDWTKDIFNTRFKSEEDLLGLRNHDTSHPSYIQSFKPNYSELADDIDYKKLIQKWRQNYLKSKYRDSNREYESFASETKPIHVPLPRPYPIEVPRPVIVPVPQPYPVKVPIPKPVAVPVIREITVPIEKLVPYPVIKKVPYPIEKPVPVPVEKQVKVPVMKPYPVHIPQIRPVFHHTKPHDDNELETDEEDHYSRPEFKRPIYKRQKNSRNRPRPVTKRPSRMTYQDRDRRRVPNRRPSYPHHNQRPRRPYASDVRAPQRYHEDFEEYDSESDFENYCKRSGKC